MPQSEIKPHLVTKPFSLLAAWLVGLVLIDTLFLSYAAIIHKPGWITPLLVIASILTVPLFLLCIFLLQTKFRPEMQEDPFYSEYLKTQKETGKRIDILGELNSIRTDVSDLQKKTIKVIDEMQSQFSALTDQVKDIIVKEKMSKKQEDSLRIIGESIDTTKDALKLVKKSADWSEYKIEVNKELSKYNEIIKRLNDNNIPIGEVFDGEPPKQFLMSIGPNVPFEKILDVFRSIYDLGLDSIKFTRQLTIYDKRIYIGAYGYDSGNYTTLTDELVKALLDTNNAQKILKKIKISSLS
jgi:hypothetical protein